MHSTHIDETGGAVAPHASGRLWNDCAGLDCAAACELEPRVRRRGRRLNLARAACTRLRRLCNRWVGRGRIRLQASAIRLVAARLGREQPRPGRPGRGPQRAYEPCQQADAYKRTERRHMRCLCEGCLRAAARARALSVELREGRVGVGCIQLRGSPIWQVAPGTGAAGQHGKSLERAPVRLRGTAHLMQAG